MPISRAVRGIFPGTGGVADSKLPGPALRSFSPKYRILGLLNRTPTRRMIDAELFPQPGPCCPLLSTARIKPVRPDHAAGPDKAHPAARPPFSLPHPPPSHPT